jgi:hypothetical protein
MEIHNGDQEESCEEEGSEEAGQEGREEEGSEEGCQEEVSLLQQERRLVDRKTASSMF